MELTNEFRVGVPVEQAWAVLTDVERIAPCLPGAQLQEIEGDQYRGIVKVKVGPITAQYKGTATFIEKNDSTHVAVLRAEGRDTRGQGNANATVTATLVGEGGATAVKVVTDLTITGKVAQFGRGVLADVSGKLIGQFVENLERDVLTGTAAPTPNPAPDAASTSPSPTQASPTQASPAKASGPTGPTPASAGRRPVTTTPAAAIPTPTSPGPAPASVAVGDLPSTNGASSSAPSGIRRIDSPEAKPVDLLSAAGSPVAKRLLPALGALAVVVLLWQLLRRRKSRS